MRVSTDVLTALSGATLDGSKLVLAGQLDRRLYGAVAKVIEAAGGKWNRKAGAHLFAGDAAAAVEPILLTGEVTSAKQEFQQFYTPPDLAARVVAAARIAPGMTVLEPSAGRGALAFEAVAAGGIVTCMEIDPGNRDALMADPRLLMPSMPGADTRHVLCGDFLQQTPVPFADRVVMNPPFAGRADVRHVMHAARFLRPGGRLVAIMPSSVEFVAYREVAEFRAFLAERGATIERLPEGSFKASGTSVNTVLVAFGGE